MAEQDGTDPSMDDGKDDARRPWVTPAIIRSSASQAEKAFSFSDVGSYEGVPGTRGPS